ncbi:plant cysteine oxidase 3 isoform X1 [Rhododendron vialii]|uniref:plant cysteine oxidase 3 isoform X1 n=1 Tax=Rhododendron vialii TaxID=182163 RepID=UPI00265DCA84|nr:plant cysteine oxidase 3 isoform X1 [Rhododendron vialii]
MVCMYRGLVTMTKKAFPSSSSSSSVQELYDLCKKTFTPSGTSPASPHAIQKLCSLLDTIRPADIGLKEEDQGDDRGHGLFGLPRFNRVGRWAQPITYVDVHECDSFTICIFCFPTSSVIPLHDHPGMTVLSKVLYGSLHVKAYDWVEPEKMQRSMGPNDSPVRLAKLTVDKVLTAPCGTSVLYPSRGGNVHCFTAITPCAMLDILTPPYQEAAGRKCTYYHDYPYSSFTTGKGDELNDGNEEDYAWLAQIGTPDDLYMRSGEYQGPVIKV